MSVQLQFFFYHQIENYKANNKFDCKKYVYVYIGKPERNTSREYSYVLKIDVVTGKVRFSNRTEPIINLS